MSEIFTQWMEVRNLLPLEGADDGASYLVAIVVVSDVLIALSFYSIFFALVRFMRKRSDVKTWPTAMFSVLALVAGTVYLASAWIPGNRVDWLDAAVRSVTALIAIAAAIFLWRRMLETPQAGSKSTGDLHDVIHQLEHEVSERLRAEQALHASQELLHQLVAYQERVKEDERKRIAREIHDELGQNLMALRIDVSVLQARIADVHPNLNEKVRIALSHIDTSIKAVRIIINNLRPSVLDLGLHAAIEWQANEFERRTGISCVLTMDDEKSGFDLDDNRATALFRILQESLTNVARHARASVVRVDLRREEDLFFMRIADNGIGLFPGCRRKPNSFGLLGIGERVSTLGGEFTVESDQGQGTVLTITIPVDAPVTVDE